MLAIEPRKGDRISFIYSDPKDGNAHRFGTIENIRRARTTPDKDVIYTIFDESVHAYRSFKSEKMSRISLQTKF